LIRLNPIDPPKTENCVTRPADGHDPCPTNLQDRIRANGSLEGREGGRGGGRGLGEWLGAHIHYNANLLTLNTSKTEFLFIGLKQQLAIYKTALSIPFTLLVT